MLRRSQFALALCLLFAVSVPPRVGAAETGAGAGSRAVGEDSRALAARILKQDGYQTDLPGVDGTAGSGHGARRAPKPRPLGGWSIPVPAGLGALVKILVWIGSAALAVVFVVTAGRMAAAVVRERRPGGGVAEAREAASGGEASAASRPPLLGEADALAEAGRFTEAVHVLLVRALAALATRRGSPFPESATSREILGSSALAPGQRVPLESLVVPVERAVFGGAALDAEDWERCRSAFRALEGGA